MVYGKLPIVDSQIQDTGMPMPFETDGWSTIKEELYDDEAYELADKLQSMNVKVPSSVGSNSLIQAVLSLLNVKWHGKKKGSCIIGGTAILQRSI